MCATGPPLGEPHLKQCPLVSAGAAFEVLTGLRASGTKSYASTQLHRFPVCQG